MKYEQWELMKSIHDDLISKLMSVAPFPAEDMAPSVIFVGNDNGGHMLSPMPTEMAASYFEGSGGTAVLGQLISSVLTPGDSMAAIFKRVLGFEAVAVIVICETWRSSNPNIPAGTDFATVEGSQEGLSFMGHVQGKSVIVSHALTRLESGQRTMTLNPFPSFENATQMMVKGLLGMEDSGNLRAAPQSEAVH